MSRQVADALHEHHRYQAGGKKMPGKVWQGHGLVFCMSIGTPLDAGNIRRSFRTITTKAGLGEKWSKQLDLGPVPGLDLEEAG
jgi:hypothetical protein